MTVPDPRPSTREMPPGPDGPADEQLAAFTADPFGAVERAAAEHGPVFTLRLGDLGNGPREGVAHNGCWVFLTRRDDIRTLYETPGLGGADANRVFFGTDEDSVGYVDGDVHRDRRSWLQPMLSGNRDHGALIEQTTARRVAGWPADGPRPLLPLLQDLTAEIITAIVCGDLPAAERDRIAATLVRTENADLGPDQAAAAEQGVKARVLDHVGHDGGGPRDLLGELAAPAPDGPGWAATTVRDEVFSLLYTGFSTTSNTLAWTLAELRADPAALATARREADAGFRPGMGHRDAAAALPYLDAVLREALRLHPVSALNGVRMAERPVTIGGHRIPAGTILVHCAHLAHRDPTVFDDPLAFRPRRFLDTPPDPYDAASFGGGSRTCVGRVFALREMRLVLAVLLRTVDLDPAPLPGARQEGIFMAPADRVLATVSARRSDRKRIR